MVKGTVVLVCNVYLRAELLEEFMQHLRDFDNKHPEDIHMQVWAHTEMSLERMKEMLEGIDRPFDSDVEIIKKN